MDKQQKHSLIKELPKQELMEAYAIGTGMMLPFSKALLGNEDPDIKEDLSFIASILHDKHNIGIRFLDNKEGKAGFMFLPLDKMDTPTEELLNNNKPSIDPTTMLEKAAPDLAKNIKAVAKEKAHIKAPAKMTIPSFSELLSMPLPSDLPAHGYLGR